MRNILDRQWSLHHPIIASTELDYITL